MAANNGTARRKRSAKTNGRTNGHTNGHANGIPIVDLSRQAEIAKAVREAKREERIIKDQIKEYEGSGPNSSLALSDLQEAFYRLQIKNAGLATLNQKLVVADTVSRSAQHAATARIGLRTATTLAAVIGHISEKVVGKITDGLLDIPEKIDIKLIETLARCAEASVSAVDRAMRLELRRAGEPDQVIGIRIGAMLDQCSDAELEIVEKTGRLPSRIALLKREAVDAEFAVADGTDPLLAEHEEDDDLSVADLAGPDGSPD